MEARAEVAQPLEGGEEALAPERKEKEERERGERPSFAIEPVELRDVLGQEGAKRFNSNNHFPDGEPPADYFEVLERTRTKHWIDAFHSEYRVLNVESEATSQLRALAEEEQAREAERGELERAAEAEAKAKVKEEEEEKEKGAGTGTGTGAGAGRGARNEWLAPKSRKWIRGYVAARRGKGREKEEKAEQHFVRSEVASLKYGLHGPGPYAGSDPGLEDILASTITCPQGHSPLVPDLAQLKFYLLPWLKLDPDREFRVFVHKRRLTAISQQFIYRTNKLLDALSESDQKLALTKWATLLHDYTRTTLLRRITHIDSFVADMAILDNDQVYFIEVNPFGAQYASGSALFHWVLDQAALHGESDSVPVRYVRGEDPWDD